MPDCKNIHLTDIFEIEGMLHIADCDYCQQKMGNDITALAKSLKRMGESI